MLGECHHATNTRQLLYITGEPAPVPMDLTGVTVDALFRCLERYRKPSRLATEDFGDGTRLAVTWCRTVRLRVHLPGSFPGPLAGHA